MWRLIAKFLDGRIESAEVGHLSSEVKRLQSELANRDDVAIPALRRELELEKRMNELYAARVEQEVRRVESETQRLAGSIANGRGL